MQYAISYRRLSDKDQSNSLDTQQREIQSYCQRNDLLLKHTFTDNGTSAFTFDRPEWKKLEKYLKVNKEIRYLVVYHIDRFSRATLLDALLKLREIEERLKVKVLSVTDSIKQDSNELSTQLNRIMQLMFSNNEYNRIKQRVTDGIYQSLSNGRYCTKAPIGYLNAKLSKDEIRTNKNAPLIIVDVTKAALIKEVFSLYNSGVNIQDIKRLLPTLNLKGNSAIQRILSNHLYAGIIKVPEYKGNPAFEVEGIHKPIITKLEYYQAYNKINKKKASIQPTEDVWLRGILHCTCGRKLTAGNSKGKIGKMYWYYKCNTHKEVNLPATKLHNEFLQILDALSFDENEMKSIESILELKIKEHQSNKGGNIIQLNLDKQKIENRIKNVNEKFLLTDGIDKAVFESTITELKLQQSQIDVSLIKAKTDTDTLVILMKNLLPKLNKISSVFYEFPLHRKQQLIKSLLPSPIWYKESYSTPYVNDLFKHKALILNEKKLLKIEQPPFEFDGFPLSTPIGSITQLELLEDLYLAFSA